MRRREFITFLGGSPVAWPLAASAQRPAMPVVGILRAQSSSSDALERTVTPLRRGLSEAGFVEGRNVAFEIRSADNDYSRLPELAADLVRHRVTVIYTAGGGVAAVAAKGATTTHPSLFTLGGVPTTAG